MFVWCAINLEKQLEDIKSEVKKIEKEIQFENSDVDNLPMHLSLCISKEVDDSVFDAVVSDIAKILGDAPVFKIESEKIELHETITWLKFKENASLETLHEKLNELFLGKYGVPLHEYDKNFMFHSTLFLDGDTDKVKRGFLRIKDYEIPALVSANSYIIGYSPDGSQNSYKVLRRIEK